MPMDSIPPFMFPTTLVAVDDDPLFLEALEFRLGATFNVATHTRATAALRSLLDAQSYNPAGRLISALPSYDLTGTDGDWRDQAVRLHTSEILDLATDPRRRQAPSVVIVDYDMPDIDGLAFCRQLAGLPIRKIMLTGKADERVAVRAFNEGVIDKFLSKDAEVLPGLLAEIDLAVGRFFADTTATLRAVLSANGSFLCDPDFCGHFRQAVAEHGIVEHYLLPVPPGLLCRTAKGELMVMLVQGPEEISGLMDLALSAGMPLQAWLALNRPGFQPWFATEEGRMRGTDMVALPAVSVGKMPWLVSMTRPSPSLLSSLRPTPRAAH